jgi:exodeoxyribonuclease VII large subunit
MSEQNAPNRTIRATNTYIKSLIETEINVTDYFWIGGEITTYHQSDRNHVYFTLEDEGYSIRCMIRSNDLERVEFPLNKGLVVDVYGTLSVYERQAQVQFAAQKIRLVDKKDVQFDTDVIKRLEEQGLFPRPKQDLPSDIRRIALVTSKNSAAVEDFRTTYHQEGGTGQIDILDVLLEGEQAPTTIVEAIKRANQMKLVDVIVLSRGGGRHMDLSTFNDYRIVEAICRSKIPVVTGIGHQEDDTLADRVADISTITPTAAAVEVARRNKAPETLAELTKQQRKYTFEPIPQYGYKPDVMSSPQTATPAWIYAAVGMMGIAIVILIVLLVQG